MPSFVISCVDKKYFPNHNLLEFSIIGKSNSGKSSLINALANSKIAHTAKTAGKTRTVNFYDFHKFWLVDMPGYGYVKESLKRRFNLEKIIEEYFLYREKICGVLHICSMDNLSNYDLEVKNYLTQRFDNYLLVINKIDKFSKLQQNQNLKKILERLSLDKSKVLLISAKYGTNIKFLLKNLITWISE